MKKRKKPTTVITTPETMEALQKAADHFFATVDYDELPDLETAKRSTDAADRLSGDWDETDEPAPEPPKGG